MAVVDAVQEISIYIHRFHNLDLFQQGWYKIKVSMRWENDEIACPGTPARVAQYEVPDFNPDGFTGIWRIDDRDNSFSTPPFQIKYAREDVRLHVMISFNFSLAEFKGPSTSAVLMKFELMYAPLVENSHCGVDDDCMSAAAVHEFRIPSNALLGLHSYCPVHFDSFHSVLIDITVHVCIHSLSSEGIKVYNNLTEALSASRHILLDELKLLSRSIGRKIDDPSSSSSTAHLWNAFLKFHRENNSKIVEYLRCMWADNRRAEWSIWMLYSKVEMPHRYLSGKTRDSSIQHHSLRGRMPSIRRLEPAQTASMKAELHRKSIAQMKMNSRSIQDMQIYGEPCRIPVVMVEHVTSGGSYFPPPPSSAGRGGVLRVVVFVHGFQGHHLDLRLIRNQWVLIDPGAEVLMSEANEDRTSGDLKEMGRRLAEEVFSTVRKKMERGGWERVRLSFVGHSIGNVIIRTALTEVVMEPLLTSLHTYVSVSGPHLGYLYSSNVLFNSGLWIMKKLTGTRCIHQLTMTDNPDPHNTFFYKLCQQKTLDHFKNVVLISSPQDGYVPYHSARIEFSRTSAGDLSPKGEVFLEMLNGCLDQIRAPSADRRFFMRCDVNFVTSNHRTNLNTIIGRAAHIEFLESDIFARFIMWSFPHLFSS